MLVKHGAMRGPIKKGVKHIEGHFSMEWKKERVQGKMRGEEKVEKRQGPILRSHLLSDMQHTHTHTVTSHVQMKLTGAVVLVKLLYCQ